MTITITGRIPSKKNSKRIVRFGKRSAIISSKDYVAWHKTASVQLLGIKPISEPIKKISVRFWWADARKTDLSNKFESLADLLVDNKIISDDNYTVIPIVTLASMGIDRKNPRAEIKISLQKKAL